MQERAQLHCGRAERSDDTSPDGDDALRTCPRVNIDAADNPHALGVKTMVRKPGLECVTRVDLVLIAQLVGRSDLDEVDENDVFESLSESLLLKPELQNFQSQRPTVLGAIRYGLWIGTDPVVALTT